VAWQNYEDRSLRYTQPEGFVARYYSPLYSEPVAAPAQALDLAAFKAEAMRLADAFYYADDENDRITKRAALAAQLDKLG
jgi:hypothetical protein